MRLTLAESRLLKDSVGIISELVSEVNFKIDKDKIEILAVDPANVVMIVFRLLGSAFIEYDVKKEESIAVSLDNLKQILRRVKPTDTLTLELDEDKNRLRVLLKGDNHRTFHLNLIDIEDREQKIPDLEFPVKVEMNSQVLEEAIEDVGIVAESVGFNVSKDRFVIESESNFSNANVELKQDEETLIELMGDSTKAKYSIEYLKKIVKGGKLADKAVVQFNKDYPLKIDFRVLNKLDLSFILAPRVDNV